MAIFLVSLAGLLLEVGYTRVISYKLWYYYTYLVIGLALLGIGSGGIFVVVVAAPAPRRDRLDPRGLLARRRRAHRRRLRRRRANPDRHRSDLGLRLRRRRTRTSACSPSCASCCSPRSSRSASSSRRSWAARATGSGGLYFADLLGAGLGCLCAIPLIVEPRAARGDHAVGADLRGRRPALAPAPVVARGRRGRRARRRARAARDRSASGCPTCGPRRPRARNDNAAYSAWGPVFRVDVVPVSPDGVAPAARRHARVPRCTSTTATRRR